jgi:hypothetical protein
MKGINGTKITLLSMALLACAASGQAGTIAITNPGFEEPAQGGIVNGAATGWSVSNGFAGVWNISSFPLQFNTAAPEGNQILFVGFFGNPADVSQSPVSSLGIDTGIVASNMTYTLSFSVGRRLDMAFSTYSVSLEANGATVLASDSAGSPTAGGFVTRTIVFNSGTGSGALGQQLGIFIHASGSSAPGLNDAQAVFDNFSLDASPTAAAVGSPEPTTSVLIGAGIIVLMLSRRRLQKQSH